MPDLDKAFVHNATDVEHVRHTCQMLRTGISTENDLVDLSRCCSPRLFSTFYLIQKMDTWGSDLVLEVHHRLKILLIGYYNIELFAEPPARRELVYVITPASRRDVKSL